MLKKCLELKFEVTPSQLFCTAQSLNFYKGGVLGLCIWARDLLKWTITTNKWKFDRNTYRFIPLKAFSLRRKLLCLCVLYQLIALHDLRGFIYIFASLWIKCESHSHFNNVFYRVTFYSSLLKINKWFDLERCKMRASYCLFFLLIIRESNGPKTEKSILQDHVHLSSFYNVKSRIQKANCCQSKKAIMHILSWRKVI